MSTALKSPTWPFSMRIYFGIAAASCPSWNRAGWDVSFARAVHAELIHKDEAGMRGVVFGQLPRGLPTMGSIR